MTKLLRTHFWERFFWSDNLT